MGEKGRSWRGVGESKPLRVRAASSFFFVFHSIVHSVVSYLYIRNYLIEMIHPGAADVLYVDVRRAEIYVLLMYKYMVCMLAYSLPVI